jgi:hypothetical protein
MKKIVPSLLLMLVFVSPIAAQHTLNLDYKQDQQGNFIFSCTNNGWCPYIVRVDLPTLENARADHAMPYVIVVKPGVMRLFKLIQTGGDVKFKYSFGYSKGCLDPHVNTGFTYLLPVGPGKQVQAYEQAVSPANPIRAGDTATTGAADLRSSYAIRLRAKPGDTLYAARRGTVTDVRVSNGENDQGVETTGNANFIEIVHADCSFAQYGVVKKDGALVKPGQFVEAGQPIGIIGGDKYGRGSEARISVRYNRKPDETQNSQGEQQATWAYVPLKFWTKRNGKGMLTHGATYTSEFPENILTQEMSKAELAKWKAKHHPAARAHKE